MPGKGVIYEKDGETILAGSLLFITENGAKPTDIEESGTAVYVMKNSSYMGCIVLADTLKADAADMTAKLRKAGVDKIYMLSGDRKSEAKRVSIELGFDGHEAEFLPHEKINALEKISKGFASRTMFIGDGRNDVSCAYSRLA